MFRDFYALSTHLRETIVFELLGAWLAKAGGTHGLLMYFEVCTLD